MDYYFDNKAIPSPPQELEQQLIETAQHDLRPWWEQLNDIEANAAMIFRANYFANGLLIRSPRHNIDSSRQLMFRLNQEDADRLMDNCPLHTNNPLYYFRLVQKYQLANHQQPELTYIKPFTNIHFASRFFWDDKEDRRLFNVYLEYPLNVTQQIGLEMGTTSHRHIQLSLGYRFNNRQVIKLPELLATERISYEEKGNIAYFNERISSVDIPDEVAAFYTSLEGMDGIWFDSHIESFHILQREYQASREF